MKTSGICLMLLAAMFMATSGHSEDQLKRPTVFVDDLGTRVDLIGRLGHPLHTVLEITGRWESPNTPEGIAKDGALLFHVTHVDGKLVDCKHRFHTHYVTGLDKTERRVEPEVHTQWRIKGYESAVITGGQAFISLRDGVTVQTSVHAKFATSTLYGLVTRIERVTTPK